MRFFRVTAKMDKRTYKKLFSSKRDNAERDFMYKILQNVDDCWEAADGKNFTFLVTRRQEKMTLGVVLLDKPGRAKADLRDGLKTAEELAGSFLDSIKIDCTDLNVDETTFHDMRQMIEGGYNNDYLRDDDETYSLLGLDQIRRISGALREQLAENLADYPMPKESILTKAADSLCAATLCPEIERIYRGAKVQVTAGHPVHYVIRSDSSEVRREILDILFSALCSNGRLKNGRYGIIRCDEGQERSGTDYSPLFRASGGGMIAVNYVKKMDDESDQICPGLSNIDDICEAVKKYKNEVLTVLCLPGSADEVMDLFMERLEGLTFLSVREEPLFGSAAEKYLSAVAQKVNAVPDKSLNALVSDPEKGFMAADLDREFDHWFSKTLKSQVYPQYGELAGDAFAAVKNKPKGSAYKELDAMIGLKGAKDVIKKAVNYFKAQTMFRDKGMKTDIAAMHMIFTGNPGSAKTTVARLFARIMKENGLLSRGELIEVGRGDLVGKYVGWTAPIVKSKFREARGSVLFIDEAYSLVDDRSGSYGDEAINTIVQEMENNRKDMVVIFAGYPDKMENFLQTNPGLRSRIAFHVPFEDYSPDELYDILEYMIGSAEMRLAPGVREKVLPTFQSAARVKDYGNGRFVRNVFERAKMNQADRLVSSGDTDVTEDDVRTLLADDFDMSVDWAPPQNTIGFTVL